MLSRMVPVRFLDLQTLECHVSSIRRVAAETLLSGIPVQKNSARFLFCGEQIPRLAPPGLPVFIEFTEGAVFLLMRRRLNRFTVLRDHEVLTRRFEGLEQAPVNKISRWRAGSVAFLCRSFLLNIYSKVDLIVTLTEEDADYIRSRFKVPYDKVIAIPGPFHQPSQLRKIKGGSAEGGRKTPCGKHLLFLANLFHGPNLEGLEWFLRECVPYLETGFTLHLCGLDGPLDHLSLATNHLSIVRHGYIEDLEQVLGWVRVGISPVVSGGGLRMKNLYLASTGRLVVTTPLGNEGIGLRDCIEGFVRSTGIGMAEALNSVARRPEQIQILGERAAARVREKFNPERIWARYREEVFAPRKKTKS